MSGEETGPWLAVDVGGTFTDLVCRRGSKTVGVLKVPSTRANPSEGVAEAIRRAVAAWNVRPESVQRFVHGTTVATNAVLERRGARLGLLTTTGFKDVLEIGRQKRTRMYDLVLDQETPGFLAPGARRREIGGRIAADGAEIEPLDEAAVEAAADALVADGVEAIAIVFLFSFANPAHERRAGEIVRARHPGLPLSLSSEVDPAYREYERTAVTAFDGYVKPVLDRYLHDMGESLAEAGIAAPLQVMMSRGGVASAAVARERPVRLLLSGPAAGVVGGMRAGTAAGTPDVITVDIGGTSCDIALVEAGRPVVRTEGVIAGYPIRVPMIDVNAIGAGGGSIAWLDAAGGLHVGPRSAGAEPGPACYGRGGAEATVTDASLVLGYLNPETFAGGTLPLDADRARTVLTETIAEPMGLTAEEAALGIHRVLNAAMAEGIRLVSIRRGHDPRRFALVGLGGGGPVHACALAEDLAITKVIVPRHPGVLSADGLLAAPVEQELSTAFARPLEGLDMAALTAAYGDLDARCGALMAREALPDGGIEVRHFADVCYIGQGYHLEVAVDLAAADPLGDLYRDFLVLHDRIHGYAAEAPARIVNLRAVHGAGGAGRGEVAARSPGRRASIPETREILLPAPWGRVRASVHSRDALTPGAMISGAAIVEQADTTTLVPPDWHGIVDDDGNLILERKAAPHG